MAEWIVYVIWISTLILILYQFMLGAASSGLMLCYWIMLAMNHFFAHSVISSSTLFELYHDKVLSSTGFEVSGYAMLGVLSSLVFYSAFVKSSTHGLSILPMDSTSIAKRLQAMNRFGTSSIVIGIVLFAIGATGAYQYLPSATSIGSSAQLLVISGVLMKWWTARMSPSAVTRRLRWLWLSIILLYPLYTTLIMGFIGFGVILLLVFFCFLWRRMNNRYILLLLSPVLVYIGLMFWVAYAEIRNELRMEIFENRTATSRFDLLVNGVYQNFSWIDPDNSKQVASLGRLNQNILIGESVRYLEQSNGKAGLGETFIDTILSLIPRVLWPGKPQYTGGSGLVTRYTGILFAESTSVGIGQIMECYVNFGRWFVFGIFFALGLILKYLDATIEISFIQYRSAQLLIFFITGVSCLNVIGSFSETLPTIVGANILATITILIHNAIYPSLRV